MNSYLPTRKIYIFCLYMLLYYLFDISFASGETKPIEKTSDDMTIKILCNIISVIGGTIAQFIGVLIIIVTGYLFLIGKIQMMLLFVIIGGTIMIFGGPTIMSWMTGGQVIECTPTDVISEL